MGTANRDSPGQHTMVGGWSLSIPVSLLQLVCVWVLCVCVCECKCPIVFHCGCCLRREYVCARAVQWVAVLWREHTISQCCVIVCSSLVQYHTLCLVDPSPQCTHHSSALRCVTDVGSLRSGRVNKKKMPHFVMQERRGEVWLYRCRCVLHACYRHLSTA